MTDATIAFIGLGNMGLPMARNLVTKGHRVAGWDASESARAAATGIALAGSMGEAVTGADIVITMLPDGDVVRAVYLGADGVLAAASAGALLIDSSTIDVVAARAVHAAAAARGLAMIDAPVSGGVAAASAGILTFMVGGAAQDFARAEPILAAMGRAIVHAGPAGNGQAAKICNNMMLGIQMISVCEAFLLAERLGLAKEKLFEIASQSSGQCWSLTRYCPVPGPLPATPANSGYKPGFAAAMMLKDLRLAQGAAADTGMETPLGAAAESLFAAFCGQGGAGQDFSGIIEWLRDYGKDQGKPR